jgi:hypothetical protein
VKAGRAAACTVLVALLLDLFTGTAAAPTPAPGAGYHHLGATTAGTWAGIVGRMEVTAPGVRDGTYDFVAARFMVKSDTPRGVKWLEAGWAQTGWSGRGRQRVYTYDTNSNRWTFYDQYPIKSGDRIKVEITADQGAWVARLWLRGAWRQLTAHALPIGGHALVEQYVEVYVDPRRGGVVTVPPIAVDDIQLRGAAGPLGWTRGAVAADRAYCVDWLAGYDSWRAGSCDYLTPA